MMNLAERYRSYAAECIRLAKSASNPDDKVLLIQMAEVWINMAERAASWTDESDGQAQ